MKFKVALKTFFFIAALIGILCLLSSNALAAGITFSWKANPATENIQGYRLYFGKTSRFYPDGREKYNFMYDQYIDFGTSQRCDGEGCQLLSEAELQCNYPDGPIVRCNIPRPPGINYFSLQAYNYAEWSSLTHELQYPMGSVTGILPLLLSVN